MKNLFLMLAVCAGAALAQDVKFYRLDFSVKELEDTKVLSTKKYTTYMGSSAENKLFARNAQIRAGSKVPYQTGPNSTNFADVGVNIDSNELREMNGQLALFVNAEISSIPAQEGPLTGFPMIRQNRWGSWVIVEPGKAVTLFSSDDLNSRRKLQLELTATLVK